MQIGMVGLGRMGSNMTRRLIKGGHSCVVYDLDRTHVATLTSEGATGATSLANLVELLKPPRAIWMMLPAGQITQQTIDDLTPLLSAGDTLIDGGNSYFKEDVPRASLLATKGVRYLDVGTSGGVWGFERGYCMMIGGNRDAVNTLTPIFKTLSPGVGTISKTPGREMESTAEHGFIYCGPSGAGHFVKMIHNGIEYGMMQAYAEGFDILFNASSKNLPSEIRYDLSLNEIAEVWRRGSVVSSWLLDLASGALAKDSTLSGFKGVVDDSGEGRWTIMAAIEEAVSAPAISSALFERFRSRKDHTFGEKLLSALRQQFGGHGEPSIK